MNIPLIIIKKLICNVVLGVDILTKCQAQIELANGIMHWAINGRTYQLFLNDNKVYNSERPTYNPIEIRRPSISIKTDHTQDINNRLNPQQARELNKLIKNTHTYFASNLESQMCIRKRLR